MEESLLLSESKDDTSNLKERVWSESKKLWKIALPAMLARVSQYGLFVVTQAFIGHVGELQLAAYAVTQIIIVRFGNGIMFGMSNANATLCGQAFGAKQYHMLGIYLQRTWIIDIITVTLMLPLFFFSTSIFKLLGQEEDIATEAGYISVWFIPIMYALIFNFTIQQFLLSQLNIMIIAWLSASSFALEVLVSWIFVTKLNLGIPGAMAAQIISTWLVTIGLFFYLFGGCCPNTWKGFTVAAFEDLMPAVKLSISSGVMVCLELWYNSLLVLLAGYLKNAQVEISAFSICVNLISWELMLCFGFTAACSVRVSNELGKGNAKAAKFSVNVILTTSLCVGVFFWILCLAFGHQIGYIFTSNEEVAEAVSSLSVLLAFSILLNSVQAVLTGSAVGSGRQSTVASINICSYYIIGVPVGVLLGYFADLKVKGIWMGMILGVLVQSLVLCYITAKTDWIEQVRKASERLNTFLKPSGEPNDSYTQVTN